MNKQDFIAAWAKCLVEGTGSVFIGAGLSKGAGYPDWRTLLRDIAKELGLDIDNEHDLAAVAQFSLNKAAGTRTRLTKLIVDHFPPKHVPPPPFQILARLPIKEVWTTNYDKLVELSWSQERKELDVKSNNDDLGHAKAWAHATLYKMHGTVDHPAKVVIATDDYELYRRERPGFLQALAGQLVTRQMLFLGFSFTDPNLSHLFAAIREAFRENGPIHYAIVRKPSRGTGKGAAQKFDLDKARHSLWVEDLQRYGIQCIEIDDYKEIDDLLRAVELRVSAGSVFVSGSYPLDGHDSERKRIEAIAVGIGEVIAQRHKRLVSGFGLTVGSAVLTGALQIALQRPTHNLDQAFLLRPFPQQAPVGMSLPDTYALYRESMVRHAALCIVVSGIRDEGGKHVLADGVLKEAALAETLGRVLLPIGSTGGAAARLSAELQKAGKWKVPGLNLSHAKALDDPALTPAAAAKIVGLAIDALDKVAS